MPAFTTITANDREATPVAHVFTPQTKSVDNIFTYVNRDGTPLGDEKLTLSVTQTGNGNHKVRLRLSIPTLVEETINGVVVPKVDRTAYANIDLTFSNRSSLQERKNTVGLLANMLDTGQAQIMAVAQDLEGIW